MFGSLPFTSRGPKILSSPPLCSVSHVSLVLSVLRATLVVRTFIPRLSSSHSSHAFPLQTSLSGPHPDQGSLAQGLPATSRAQCQLLHGPLLGRPWKSVPPHAHDIRCSSQQWTDLALALSFEFLLSPGPGCRNRFISQDPVPASPLLRSPPPPGLSGHCCSPPSSGITLTTLCHGWWPV